MKKYIIKLSDNERKRLQAITRKGNHGARVIRRARILLASNAGIADVIIATAMEVVVSTVQRIRERYHDGGLDRALHDASRPGTPRALSDKQEAHLVALACSNAPQRRIHWTIELLRERMIADGVTNRMAVGTIHARLTERSIKPWREKNVGNPDHHT